MSVTGLSSDRIIPEGEYISPSLDLPSTGRYWNYRVFKANTCEFYSICKAFYQDGKFMYRAVSPEKITALSPDGVALVLKRLEEAWQMPPIPDDISIDRKATNLASYLFDHSFPACSWDTCEHYANELLYFGEGVPLPILELWKKYVV